MCCHAECGVWLNVVCVSRTHRYSVCAWFFKHTYNIILHAWTAHMWTMFLIRKSWAVSCKWDSFIYYKEPYFCKTNGAERAYSWHTWIQGGIRKIIFAYFIPFKQSWYMSEMSNVSDMHTAAEIYCQSRWLFIWNSPLSRLMIHQTQNVKVSV